MAQDKITLRKKGFFKTGQNIPNSIFFEIDKDISANDYIKVTKVIWKIFPLSQLDVKTIKFDLIPNMIVNKEAVALFFKIILDYFLFYSTKGIIAIKALFSPGYIAWIEICSCNLDIPFFKIRYYLRNKDGQGIRLFTCGTAS